MTLYTQRQNSINSLSLIPDMKNRINFLGVLNEKINKKMLSFMNRLQKSHKMEKKYKSSFKQTLFLCKQIQKPSIFASKSPVCKLSTGISFFPSPSEKNQKASTQLRKQQKNKDKESKFIIRNQKAVTKTIQKAQYKAILSQGFKNESQFLEKTKPNQEQIDKQVKIKKINNYCMSSNRDKPENRLIIQAVKSQRQEQKTNQRLKLIQLKKKLLQQEEKSLIEYQNCILQKQKLIQQFKKEQRKKQQRKLLT